jgi:hypothetical protein
MSPKLRLGDITSMLSTLHPCLITGPTFLWRHRSINQRMIIISAFIKVSTFNRA